MHAPLHYNPQHECIEVVASVEIVGEAGAAGVYVATAHRNVLDDVGPPPSRPLDDFSMIQDMTAAAAVTSTAVHMFRV